MSKRSCSLLALSMVAAVGAQAQSSPPVMTVPGFLTPYMLQATQKTGGGWVVSQGNTFAQPALRSYTSSLVGGNATLSAAEALSIAGRAGNLPVSVGATVAFGDAAAAVARCLAGAVPLCAAAGAAYAAYSIYRAFNPAQVPGSSVPAGSLDYDSGQQPITQNQTVYKCSGGCTQNWPSANASAVVSAEVAYRNSTAGACSYTSGGAPVNGTYVYSNGGVVGSDADGFIGTVRVSCSSAFQSSFTVTVLNYGLEPVKVCGASVDAFDPAFSIPAGAPPSPVDGKCPTARGNHIAVTPSDLAAKVEAIERAKNPVLAPAPEWGPALREAIEAGKQTVPAAISSTGPATQTGNPVSATTQTPTGTTTKTQTPVYNYNYAGDTINYTTTFVDVTNEGGTTTTTTTTTNEPPKTCGRPEDPKCNVIVDETGTPDTITDPKPKADDALARPKQIGDDPKGFFPQLPSLNWSFSLPMGCAAIPLPAFEPMISSIDICPFQPMFNDIMSVVWIGGAVFGAMSLFMRDALAT